MGTFLLPHSQILSLFHKNVAGETSPCHVPLPHRLFREGEGVFLQGGKFLQGENLL
jgi:hypothetical protein